MTDGTIPMPAPTVPKKPLKSFKVISYDIYGTLIDWESGILQNLQQLASRIPSDSKYASLKDNNNSDDARLQLAALHNHYEAEVQQEQPDLIYSQLLPEAYLRMAREFGIDITEDVKAEAQRHGQSIGTWSAFPDTVDACQRLVKQGYKLVPLSNVDRESFAKTCARPLKGVEFFKVYTAQDIGSYKPDQRNFDYLISHVKEDAGVEKDEILHVAQSIFHDHRPAKKAGLSSVWINRKGAGMGAAGGIKQVHERGEVGYGWRFGTLGELADEVEKEAAATK